MASPQHPGNPGWMGPITQSTSRTEQEASAMDPDLPCPGPKRHLDRTSHLPQPLPLKDAALVQIPEGTVLPDDHSGPSSNSSMTTRELQENWQKEKGRWKPVRLLFEIASARIEERRVSKFVVYQIVVIQTGSFDSHKAVVERRYSDFEKMHKSLLKSFGEEIEDVAFPRKHLTCNLAAATISERARLLKDYLRQLYAIRAVRRSRDFVDFLTRPELREAFGCLRAGQYARALDVLGRVLPLQEKLTAHWPPALVPALCAVLVCHRDLERPAEAFAAGERALHCLQAREGHRYYVPLLEAMVRLAYELGKDLVSLQGRLDDSRLRKPSHGGFTLKELTVREYLP